VCSGCCAGSTCIPLANTSAINCGINAAACAACGAGQICGGGYCLLPDGGSIGGVGDSCNQPSDCVNVPTGNSGGPTFCKKNAMVFDGITLSTGYAYPGGYCTRRCTQDAQCGSGARCIYYLGLLGDLENICLAQCGPSTAFPTCRPGYLCVSFGVASLCVVAAPDGGIYEWDAGRGANDNVMGMGCNNDATCQPPPSGACTPATYPDGGPTGYVGGSCSADCSMAVSDEWCGRDAGTCVPAAYSTSQGPLVLWSCERICNPLQGNTGCRSSYVCEQQYAQYPDYGVCTPSCTNAGYVCPNGTSCTVGSGLCQ
jgi:hypothetical protein